ncbi:peptidoglycan-binding protein LysM [Flavobacterium sp.]|uniref:peptidoglycan-binding protein LysM n=1 Tax=Flavobacterium sp. TaxID=239 RepID=UPI002625C7E5|nr:peptidoglycan-binding protein LysM [Flavobacterium sp.]MDD3004039.1 peptidoglycan-binding protein LysM [Flavobacterium sp.]
MIKKWIYYTSITLIIAFISLNFKAVPTHNRSISHNEEASFYFLPSLENLDMETGFLNFTVPYTGKTFTGFKEALAFKESQGKYTLINSLGYMGKYQFGHAALKAIGIHDSSQFLKDPRLQEKAFKALLAKNKWELRKEIEEYDGKVINGVEITESGILAAAHLGGAGSVKKFFKSQGKRTIKDDYGTSLQSYMKRFGGYDTSFIEANGNIQIK